MRLAALLTLLAASITLFVGFSATKALPEAPVGEASAPPFAVVELFTSQGCSSCPPADRVLDTLASAAQAQGKAVYALAYHVDYWDRLGWRDPFGDPRFTARQGRYVRALGRDQLYTPQMVVNGRAEFVGSSRRAAKAAIASALSEAATVAVAAKVAHAGTDWRVDYTVKGAPPGLRVVAALTESGQSVAVPRGENAGATLTHDHPVRAFAEQPLLGDAGQMNLTARVDPARAQLVVFVQDPVSMAILGATRGR